jgi:hypothetical protein
MVMMFRGVSDDDEPKGGPIIQLQLDITNQLAHSNHFVFGVELRNAVYYWLCMKITLEILLNRDLVKIDDAVDTIKVLALFKDQCELMIRKR